MRILVTRPAFFAKSLCQKIRNLGFIPELFPVIEITPRFDQKTVMKPIQALDQADIAIFISRSAAYYGAQCILDQWTHFPPLCYAAIGPGTQETLEQLGLQQVLIPNFPPFESESLLKHPELQSVRGKTILIFQGNGGRSLLSDTLRERSATVINIECYQRRLPVVDWVKQELQWRQNPIQLVLLTSLEGLKNLVELLGPRLWAEFQTRPMIVVGPRLQEQARRLGVEQIITVSGADDATLVDAVVEFGKKIQ